jgi:hypothetical protein
MSVTKADRDKAKRMDLKPILESRYGLVFDKHNRCLCPFHEDHDPSLSVFQGKDGFWRWKCLGCNKGGDILDFLMLKDDLKQGEALASLGIIEQPSSAAAKRGSKSDQAPAATYIYRDESGAPLYRKRKFSSRSYLTDRYENGKWVSKLGDTRRVLYDLPELVAASKVFLLEGEKDCETVKALGLVATTMGAVTHWKHEFAKFFEGKDVVICFDVGNEKFVKTAASDISGIANRVRVLALPDLTEREQDITDWFNKTGSVTPEEKIKRLNEAVDGTPDFVPPDKASKIDAPARTPTLSEFLSTPTAPRDVFMECWAEREHLTILSGPQKVGKSILAVNLGLNLSMGVDFLGFRVPKPRRVLYIQQEISDSAMRERLQMMIANLGLLTENFMIENTHGVFPKLPSREGQERLRELLTVDKPDFLILDPLSTFHNRDENSATEMTVVLEPIFDLKHEFRIGVLLVHHFGKPSIVARKGSHRLRGSSVIGDRADNLIMLDPVNASRTGTAYPPECYGRISFSLRNDLAPNPFAVVRDPATLWYRRLSHEQASKHKLPASRIAEIVRDHGGQIKQAELERLPGIGGSRGTVREAVREAVAGGLIVPDYLPEPGRPVILKTAVRAS